MRRAARNFCENYGDGEEGGAVVAVGPALRVAVSALCFARSRMRETAGINKLIKMAITAITISNSSTVNAPERSRSFGMVNAKDILFAFIGNRRCARLAKFSRNSQ
jgi:hypothetical protein